MIYTSYFAKIKELERNNIIPISICAKVPDWYKGLQYKKLAPSYSLLMDWKRYHNEQYYIEYFGKYILSKLDPSTTYLELCELVGSTNIALICYEKPSDFCHRHLVAEWLNQNGFKCEEWRKQ